ncbi:MAG TPA: hypothetical protein VHU88_10315 [Sporichthyaceae bacterium]|jgi:hypothetical protein|nr:hypothetical protein [Sporichthyaceae bacterium]
MGTITRVYDAFVNLATVDGTVHDRNTDYMFLAAGLICLLSIYFLYNFAAMTVNGAKRTYRAGRWVVASVAGEGEPHVAAQIPAQAGATRSPARSTV